MKDRVPNKKALMRWPTPCSPSDTALMVVDGSRSAGRCAPSWCGQYEDGLGEG